MVNKATGIACCHLSSSSISLKKTQSSMTISLRLYVPVSALLFRGFKQRALA